MKARGGLKDQMQKNNWVNWLIYSDAMEKNIWIVGIEEKQNQMKNNLMNSCTHCWSLPNDMGIMLANSQSNDAKRSGKN